MKTSALWMEWGGGGAGGHRGPEWAGVNEGGRRSDQ